MPVNLAIAQAKAKLTTAQVVKIRRIYRDMVATDSGIGRKLAREYRVSPAAINNVVTRRTYTWITEEMEKVHHAEESFDCSATSDVGAGGLHSDSGAPHPLGPDTGSTAEIPG